MRARLLFATAVFAALAIVNAGTASANEYSCANAAAANSYVNANKFLLEVQQDCAVAYGIANADGVSTQSEAATGKGNASKSEVVAAYATAWPDSTRDKNIEDRADASPAAALGVAHFRRDVLPFKLTGPRRKALAKVGQPSIPLRLGDVPAAA